MTDDDRDLRKLVGYERQLYRMKRVDLCREAGRWGVSLSPPGLTSAEIVRRILSARGLDTDNNYYDDNPKEGENK